MNLRRAPAHEPPCQGASSSTALSEASAASREPGLRVTPGGLNTPSAEARRWSVERARVGWGELRELALGSNGEGRERRRRRETSGV